MVSFADISYVFCIRLCFVIGPIKLAIVVRSLSPPPPFFCFFRELMCPCLISHLQMKVVGRTGSRGQVSDGLRCGSAVGVGKNVLCFFI